MEESKQLKSDHRVQHCLSIQTAGRQSRAPIRDLGFVKIWTLFIRCQHYLKINLPVLAVN